MILLLKNKIVFSVGLMSALSVASQAENLKVAADPWCPFTCASKSSRPGVLIEVLREAMGTATLIDYEEVSWSRAVNETRAGKYDAIVGALKTDAPDFVFPAISLAQQKSCFFVAPDSKWKFKDISSLNAQVLGAVNDYTYGEPVDAYIKANAQDPKKIDLISGTETAERLLKKLQDHRIDVMVEDNSVVSYVLSGHPELKRFAPKRVFCQKPQPLFVAFSPANEKTSKELAKKLSEGLKKMRTNKRLQKIFSEYGLTP